MSEFGRLCLGFRLQSSCITFALIKLRVYILQLVFKYYGPASNITSETVPLHLSVNYEPYLTIGRVICPCSHDSTTLQLT